MIRRELTTAQWRRIEQLVPGKEGDKGRHGEDNRLFVDAVLWIARAGAPWRDLPEEFGNWNSVWKRFWRLSQVGVFEAFFEALAAMSETAHLVQMFDSTVVRAHVSAAGAKGGSTTKLSAAHAVGFQPRFI